MKGRPVPGEATDRRQLFSQLAKLGLRAKDPYRGTCIGEVYLMLTMDCNLRCRACAVWGVGGACHSKEFYRDVSRPTSKKRLLAFIDELKPYRPQNINIAGGEPLLTPLWPALAERAKKHGIRTMLTTNGVLLEKHVDRVADLFDQVNVSVACPPAMREKLRMGPPGHYEAMLRGLKGLIRRRDSGRGPRPLVRLICEIFDSNAAHLGELVDHLDQEGIVFDEILFQHLIFNRPEVLSAQEAVFRDEFDLPLNLWKGYAYKPQNMDFPAFDKALSNLRERHPDAQFSVDLPDEKALREYYGGRGRSAGETFCDGPWTQVNLFPSGDIWACPDFIMGNINDKPFADIWEGKMARSLRRRVSKTLFPACRGCFSFYNSDLIVERGDLSKS